MKALRASVSPTWVGLVALLIGVVPIAAAAVSQATAFVASAPLGYLTDGYFRAMVIARAGLWLLVGRVLWSEGREQ